MGSDCEGAGEMFRVTTLDMNNIPKTEDGLVDDSKDFFKKSTNLTVSESAECWDIRACIQECIYVRTYIQI